MKVMSLGAFAGSLRASVSYVMSVRPPMCPSVCTYQRGFHWTDFSEIRYWGAYMKICRETSNLLIIGQKHTALYMNT